MAARGAGYAATALASWRSGETRTTVGSVAGGARSAERWEHSTRVPGSYVPALRFDRLTALYDPLVRLTTREAAFKRRLLDQAAPADGDRVLDVGCGTGTLAIEALRREPRVEMTGLDGDPVVLSRARAKAGAAGADVRFDQALSDRMPYADASFDVVLSSLFFHHLVREVKERTIREIARVLRPGGRLHVADWGPPRDAVTAAVFLAGVRLFDGLAETRDNVRGELPRMFAAGGLSDARELGGLRVVFGRLAFYSARRAAA